VGKLSALAVKAIRFPGGKEDRPVRFGDGDGLYLQVAFGDNKRNVSTTLIHPGS